MATGGAVGHPRTGTVRGVLGSPALLTLALLLAVVPVIPRPAAAAHQAPGFSAGELAGWELLRHLDRLAALPVGVRSLQTSSFDRSGGNEDGFVGAYSCLRRTVRGCVLAEATGAGQITSIWATRDGGMVSATGRLRIELDDEVVVDAPLQDVVAGRLGPPFTFPLVATADQSSGGVYIKVPMPYRRSMRVTTEDDPRFYHVDYQAIADAASVPSFRRQDSAADVVDTLRGSGLRDPKPAVPEAAHTERTVRLLPGQNTTLAELSGPAMVTSLQLQLPTDPPDGPTGVLAQSRVVQLPLDAAAQGVRLVRTASTPTDLQRAPVLVDGTELDPLPAPAPVPGGVEQVVELPPELTAGRDRVTVQDLTFTLTSRWRVDTLIDGEWRVGLELVADPPLGALSADEDALPVAEDLLAQLRLRITFDGVRTVDTALGDFFATGSGRVVRALMIGASPDGTLTSWWPMPYADSVRVELYNGTAERLPVVRGRVTTAPLERRLDPVAGTGGWFHAHTADGETGPDDWEVLDAAGHGKLVGLVETLRGREPGRHYLEGDERVLVDGNRSPAWHGTGTEDLFEGGWYFNRGEFTLPFNGASSHQVDTPTCEFECDTAYRLFLTDSIPFEASLWFGQEHGPRNDVAGRYRTTAFWYGRDSARLRRTDAVDVGVAGSEAAHAFRVEGPLRAFAGESAFEGDDDAPVAEEGVESTAPTTFQLSVDPAADAVVLRRLSRQAVAGQAARVRIDGADAGTWTQPLGNRDSTWLEDEFLVPPRLTAERAQVTVRLEPIPGAPPWSAARYEALAVVPPFRDTQPPGAPEALSARSGPISDVLLSWKPASDATPIRRYEVYSRTAGNEVGGERLVGTTRTTGFVARARAPGAVERFRVVAVDVAGNRGSAAEAVAVPAGSRLRVEAESLLPAVSASAPVLSQDMGVFGPGWSGRQLWLRAVRPGDQVTVAVQVPRAGTYGLSVAYTRAGDYGQHVLLVDGRQVGPLVDGFVRGVVPSGPVDHGFVELSEGLHTLRFEVAGKTPPSSGYFLGVDWIELEALPVADPTADPANPPAARGSVSPVAEFAYQGLAEPRRAEGNGGGPSWSLSGSTAGAMTSSVVR